MNLILAALFLVLALLLFLLFQVVTGKVWLGERHKWSVAIYRADDPLRPYDPPELGDHHLLRLIHHIGCAVKDKTDDDQGDDE